MNHILNIRGTNGSGKTSLARALMRKLKHYKDFKTSNGVFCHVYLTPYAEYVTFIGQYSGGAASGGVDRVKNVRDVIQAVREVSEYGHVIMEGLLISGLQTLTREVADAAADFAEFHVITLNTPLDVCIKQTLSRRAEAGNTKEFDPEKSLVPKHRAVELAHAKLTLWGMNTVLLSQMEAFEYICGKIDLAFSQNEPILKSITATESV